MTSIQAKHRPITFNGDMVRSILSGEKTQSRRIASGVMPDNCLWIKKPTKNKNGVATHVIDAPKHGLCPFGNVGDRLWVRETWGVVSYTFDEDGRMIDWVPDRPAKRVHEMKYGRCYYSGHIIYRSDGPFVWCGDDDGGGDDRTAWHPSIHMPREASRITLEITEVRVERLNNITERDSEAEGVSRLEGDLWKNYCRDGMPRQLTARDSYATLWDSIYGSGSWQTNPWVWVIEFKLVK
ncbi:MAG: hypothetical protein ACRCVE_12360 [Plesiomonas sp.]